MLTTPDRDEATAPASNSSESFNIDISVEELARGRQSGRLTINKEFESFDAFIHEYVTNISKSGVFIKSKSPLTVGTKVNLRFTLIMDDIETIEGTGEVVRVESDPCGMGITFTDLQPESRALLDRLLAASEAVAAE